MKTWREARDVLDEGGADGGRRAIKPHEDTDGSGSDGYAGIGGQVLSRGVRNMEKQMVVDQLF